MKNKEIILDLDIKPDLEKYSKFKTYLQRKYIFEDEDGDKEKTKEFLKAKA